MNPLFPEEKRFVNTFRQPALEGSCLCDRYGYLDDFSPRSPSKSNEIFALMRYWVILPFSTAASNSFTYTERMLRSVFERFADRLLRGIFPAFVGLRQHFDDFDKFGHDDVSFK